MDLVKIEKIRVGLEERLRSKGYDKTYLSLEFGFFGTTIKVEVHHAAKNKWFREKRMIKFRDLIKMEGIDDVTYIQQEVNHIEYVINNYSIK